MEAAEKEIEYHRSIACELEQSMLEDFEWKIHEIEADYHRRLKDGSMSINEEMGAVGGGYDVNALKREMTKKDLNI